MSELENVFPNEQLGSKQFRKAEKDEILKQLHQFSVQYSRKR
jgi:hypothetical protein